MEQDGITRVYIASSMGEVRQAYPERSDRNVTGEKAAQILYNADYKCLDRETFTVLANGEYDQRIRSIWECYDPANQEKFEIDRMNWTSQEYESNLAKELERRTAQTGLTIVVY